MTKASDYDEEIARYEALLKQLKTERSRLQRREENVEMRRLKIQNSLLTNERDVLQEQRDAMMEWLRRERTYTPTGQKLIFWNHFIRSYPEFEYLNS